MQLSDKDVQEYKSLNKKNFGKDISDAEALEQGTRLVNLVKLLYKIDRRKESK
jgi:hypothetical protein